MVRFAACCRDDRHGVVPALCHSHAIADPDAHTNSIADAHPDADPDAHTNSIADAHPDSYPDTLTYANSDADRRPVYCGCGVYACARADDIPHGHEWVQHRVDSRSDRIRRAP